MADYTPTTEYLRGYLLSDDGSENLATEHFDRWLTAHDRKVAERTWDECMTTPAGSRVNPYRTA